MLSVFFIWLALVTTAKSDWTDCPPCHCKWTSGKKTALCSTAGLTVLPNISSDIQVIDLYNNSITYLKSEAFHSIDLPNLQKIFMKNTSLTVIHKEAFKNLKILIEVDLSDNQLTSIPQGIFTGNDRLKVVVLSGNPIRELVNYQFPNLPHLRSLEIENCKIQIIQRDALFNLKQLEILNIRKNFLEYLSEQVFNSLVKLKSLALENNPWKCDCKLRSLRNWFLVSKLSSVSLVCSQPSLLLNRQWEDIDPREFACPPQAHVAQKMVQRDVGENATITCLVKGDPEPESSWHFNGHPISNRNSSIADQNLLFEYDDGGLNKWLNITFLNLSEANSGEYSCVAKNILGIVSQNVSLVLPQVVTATTLSKADKRSPYVSLVCGGIVTVVFCIILSLICGYQKRKRVSVQKDNRDKGNGNLLEQNKKLIDISIGPAADGGAWNSDMIRTSESESRLLDASPSVALSSLDSCEPLYTHQAPTQSVVIPIGTYATNVSVYPPPPEFSTGILPTAGFGNIFISVSVSQDPYSDIQRYPDLLDIPYKSSVSTSCASSVSSCSQPSGAYSTLPRKPLRAIEQGAPPPPTVISANDKLGPRVTLEGNSIIFHSEEKDIIPPPQCSSFGSEFVSL